MSDSEVLRVTGIGSTRLHALADADRQCAQYWDGAHTRAPGGHVPAAQAGAEWRP